MSLELCPLTLREAHAFVARFHRHHRPSQGGKFAIGAARAGEVVGAVIVGRPVSRLLQNGGWTAEVLRLAVVDRSEARNACSMLYGAAWRAARAMGYRRLVTYTLATESGVTLRAAGWREIGRAGGGSWDRLARPRVDQHPTQGKIRWEVAA